jgi:hypothetical protein
VCPFSGLDDGLLSREDEEEFGMLAFISGSERVNALYFRDESAQELSACGIMRRLTLKSIPGLTDSETRNAWNGF